MLKLTGAFVAAALALFAPVSGAQAVAGPDATYCEAGEGPALLVRVEGFKAYRGMLRIQVYGSDPSQFVKGGERVRRIDVPVAKSGPMSVCVKLPHEGNYAVAVRHDVDGDGKGGINDGGGFSRNPKISLGDALSRRMPKYQQVVINAGPSVRPVDVVLNYRQGLSIKPIAMASR